MVTIRFIEFEACVATIASKVKEALGEQEHLILTDSQGNQIIDSEGTRGKCDEVIILLQFLLCKCEVFCTNS